MISKATIMVPPMRKPRMRLDSSIVGWKMAIKQIVMRYTKIPCSVGTGFLVFLRSFPGLSRMFNFLKRVMPAVAILMAKSASKTRFIAFES